MTGADAQATIATKPLRFGDPDLIEAIRVLAVVEELRARAGGDQGPRDCCPGCLRCFWSMSPAALERHRTYTAVELRCHHTQLTAGRRRRAEASA